MDESAVLVARSGIFSGKQLPTTQRASEVDGTSANPFPVADNDNISFRDDSDDEDLLSVQDFLDLSKPRSGAVVATVP